MTAEELLLDETHAWLVRARNGLASAKVLTDGQMYAAALFHCQQAAEKALKSFLTFHQRPFRKTHALHELSAEILAIDGSLRSTLETADGLSDYAWRFRYPGAPYEPDAAEALSALQKAETTVHEIEHRLPPGSEPEAFQPRLFSALSATSALSGFDIPLVFLCASASLRFPSVRAVLVNRL